MDPFIRASIYTTISLAIMVGFALLFDTAFGPWLGAAAGVWCAHLSNKAARCD